MIGQVDLKNRVEQLINNNIFPRFSIFVGPKGSGKKTFVREVIKELTDGLYVECGTRVDDVRDFIADAYKVHSLAVFFIPDADNMSNVAKNALLKVTEEPPNNAYFIMTLEDENNTLETIRSRGTVFHMDRYTPDEIFKYYWSLEGSTLTSYYIPNLCDTPGDVQTLIKMGVSEFYDYVQLVVDNIAEVSLANAFKIPSKLALKDGDEGYDLRLFLKAFYKICGDRFFIDLEQKYGDGLAPTQTALQQLRIKGINKQMLIDNWILEVRNVWS